MSLTVKKAVILGALTPLLYYGTKIISTFMQAIPNSEKHAGTIVAEVLKAHGVTRIFCLPGGHVSPVVVACETIGITIVDTRHEADAVFAADATSRLTGTIGVAIVTAGPGVTNTVTAMKNAQMAHSPLLLIGGAAATISRGRGSLQDIEQLGLFQSICKHAISVTRIQDVADAFRKAIQIAQSGTPGPVFVELPIDILYPIMELKANMGLLQRSTAGQLTDENRSQVIVPHEQLPKTATAYVAGLDASTPVFLPAVKKQNKIVELFMTYQLKRIFGKAWIKHDVEPLKVLVPFARDREVQKVATILSKATRPVCIVGSQIIVNPEINNDHISDALQGLGIPCFLSGMARGMMGRDHPRFIRQNRKEALKAADVVLLLGVNVDFRLDYGRSFSRASKVITVNRCKDELVRNTDVMWKPYMKLEADPSHFLINLKRTLSVEELDVAWANSLKQTEKIKESKNATKSEAVAVGRANFEGKNLVNPIKLCTIFADIVGDRKDVILIGDGGDFVATAANIVRPNGACSWLDPGPYGTLGVGGGFALAAKMANPTKHVVIFWGDGSAGYSIAEFDVFARHHAPVIAIVGNDACWSQIVRDQKTILGSTAACHLAYCQYATIAQSYGGQRECEAITIQTEQEIAPAIRKAFSNSEAGVSTCLNVMIGRSDFREGSLSV